MTWPGWPRPLQQAHPDGDPHQEEHGPSDQLTPLPETLPQPPT
jgi:hypothetical protein